MLTSKQLCSMGVGEDFTVRWIFAGGHAETVFEPWECGTGVG
jgi:hypothetical protein